MKLVSYRHKGTSEWGLIEGDQVVRIADSVGKEAGSLRAWLRHYPATDLEDLARGADRIDVGSVSFLPPIPDAQKIICVGLNYRDHVLEMGREMPEKPVIFTRFADTLVGHGQPLVAPSASTQFDYEGELAVVMGKSVRSVSPTEGLDAVLGYSPFNDGTIRDYQRHTHQFTPGKNFPRTGSMGPWIVTPDEVPDITPSTITTAVNGLVVQDSTIDQLVFDVGTLISYISQWTELHPGDIIATGTPGGVGDMASPQRWLTPGTTVEVTISGVGTLRNSVIAEGEARPPRAL